MLTLYGAWQMKHRIEHIEAIQRTLNNIEPDELNIDVITAIKKAFILQGEHQLHWEVTKLAEGEGRTLTKADFEAELDIQLKYLRTKVAIEEATGRDNLDKEDPLKETINWDGQK